ncbi:MAG: hypothetical protein ACP5PT_05745, partial [Brevinematia bacterium]
FNDIELVILNGIPYYGFSYYEDIIRNFDIDYSKVVIDGKERFIVGDLEKLMRTVWEFLGFRKQLPFIPIYVND